MGDQLDQQDPQDQLDHQDHKVPQDLVDHQEPQLHHHHHVHQSVHKSVFQLVHNIVVQQKKVDSTFWDSVMALTSLRIICAYITQLTQSFGSSAFFIVQKRRKFIFIQDVVNIYF